MGDLTDIVERLDHISVAVWDIRASAPLAELMGGTFRDGGLSFDGEFHWAQWDLPSGKLEMIAPVDRDADTFLTAFLSSRGEGPHHLTFKVPNLAAAVGAARDLGFDVVGQSDDLTGWKEAFVHPASAHGVLIQLAEFTDGWRSTTRTLDDALAEGQ